MFTMPIDEQKHRKDKRRLDQDGANLID